MEFREARSLAVLAKVESIAKTAEQMHLTPAAVHKQIKNLEREFGVCLYEKTGRAVHLTAAAHEIMPYVEELLAQYEGITAALSEWKGLRRGFVRIGANPATSSFMLPELLLQFRQNWPGVTAIVDVDSSANLLHRVANRSLEVAVGLWDSADLENVSSHARWSYELVPVIRSAGHEVTAEQLKTTPYIKLPRGLVLTTWADDYLAANDLHPAEVMVVNNAHTLLALIRSGLGFGVLPTWVVADEIRNQNIAVVELGGQRPTGQLELITPKTAFLPPAVKAFINLARRPWEGLAVCEGQVRK
jgi:DNA-binding transcriptional LysR family regulator